MCFPHIPPLQAAVAFCSENSMGDAPLFSAALQGLVMLAAVIFLEPSICS